MNAIAQTEFNPSLAVINGTIKTTSLKVAEHFGKQHKSVLRSIKNLECSTNFIERNFAPMLIDVEIGQGAIRQDPAYEMTKDGFTFLAMGFTGKEAAKWKEAYINAFNAMADSLQQPAIGYEALLTEFQCQNQHVHELLGMINEQKAKIGELLPKQEPMQHNSITINLAPLSGECQSQRIMFRQHHSGLVELWGVTETREQFIQELRNEGYVVMKKEQLLGRVKAIF